MVRSAKLTPLGLCVLELLFEKPMHPYEMHQTMAHRYTQRVVKLKAGSLYHTVERLEKLGLIEIAETSRAGRRPERTLYRITDAGQHRFAEEVPELIATIAEEYPAFPLGLSLGDDLGKESMLEALRSRREELQKHIETDTQGVARLQRIQLPKRFWFDLRYSLAMKSAELAFVNELIDDLESGLIDWNEAEPCPVQEAEKT